MPKFPSIRSIRNAATSRIEEVLPSSSIPLPRKRWTTVLPLIVSVVVISEIFFIGRLNVADNAALFIDSVTGAFSFKSDSPVAITVSLTQQREFHEPSGALSDCEDWLQREDVVDYTRDFSKVPVSVVGSEEANLESCAVPCRFGNGFGETPPDATLRSSNVPGTAAVLRSMESSLYYPDNDIANARRKGYDVVMTTSLSSDVPVGYFSWAEYDIMAPIEAKTEKALAVAFISNCAAHNFRLQALDALEQHNIPIDSYGNCHRNRHEDVNKVKALKRYKFSLAFENSNEEDYVTEKYFQSLVAGTIPVVIGAPNIADFSPADGAVLHIKELSDVGKIAEEMRYLAGNPEAFNRSLRWKREGPSDSFKALVDMAAVHSSCRLCIHLATRIREKEERGLGVGKRGCKCERGGETVYHLRVRERGRFEMESVFLRSGNLSVGAMEDAVMKKFEAIKHEPIWRKERPESIRGKGLRVYRIYPLGLTQREALYRFRFGGDDEFRRHVMDNPCGAFEVVFV